MKIFIATAFVVAIVLAEPPPSNSYLPPPPTSRGTGYPQGPQTQNFAAPPEVIAARSFEGHKDIEANNIRAHGATGIGPHGGTGVHGIEARGNGVHGGIGAHGSQDHDVNDVHGNGFARSGPHGHGASPQARFGDEQHGYEHSPAFGKNALDQADEDPANYNFGYMVNDYQEGTEFGHHEERQDERAQGEYHVVLPDGRKQTVSYEADERGFKPQISYEETEDPSRSGYDSNANNIRANDHHDNGYNGNSNHGNGGPRSAGY